MSEKIKDKYVFPPEFDFFRNPKSRPIAMYIFDFEHTFDRDDLSYIWQNIAPKIGNEFQESEATASRFNLFFQQCSFRAGRFWFRPGPQRSRDHRRSSATSRISAQRECRPVPKDALSG